MAFICAVCGKGRVSGFNISHSHRKTKRTWMPNLQKTTVITDNGAVKVRACAKCIKTQSKETRTKKSSA